MSYFGKFYLDKEKDIVVNLDMEDRALSYTILVNNHKSDNLINNLAIISRQKTVIKDGKTMIKGEIPCYIKGESVYYASEWNKAGKYLSGWKD